MESHVTTLAVECGGATDPTTLADIGRDCCIALVAVAALDGLVRLATKMPSNARWFLLHSAVNAAIKRIREKVKETPWDRCRTTAGPTQAAKVPTAGEHIYSRAKP